MTTISELSLSRLNQIAKQLNDFLLCTAKFRSIEISFNAGLDRNLHFSIRCSDTKNVYDTPNVSFDDWYGMLTPVHKLERDLLDFRASIKPPKERELNYLLSSIQKGLAQSEHLASAFSSAFRASLEESLLEGKNLLAPPHKPLELIEVPESELNDEIPF